MKKGNFNKKHKNDNLANNKKKIFNKVNKIEIKQQFLVIGLVAIITLISLIYFIFLKYSPVMNFKYEGYGVSGKQITENLLGAGNKDTSKESGLQNSNLSGNEEKNVSLSKIEEQGTIFKKLNSYFIGNKEKTEIDLSYPIYINDKNTIYNLNQDITLISKNFEQIAGYPNISITDGKVYDGNSLERADSKEYIFAKTEEGIYINLKEIKIGTTANEYVLPVNSLIVFEEDVIRYYSVQNNILMFNEIKDVDYNSQIIIKNIEEALDQNSQKVDKEYNYEELLTRLGIIENAKDDVEKEEIIEEDTIDDKQENNTESETEPTAPQDQKPENNEQTNAEYIKPEVTVEDFKAEVYTAKSNLNIKDPKARIIEAPTFEIYKEGKIYLRRVFKNSGEIQITGLVPETEYEIIGKYIYLNAENKKIENTFYKGTIKTKGYEALGTIELSKEEGEIYSNKIQIKNVKIISDLQNEAIKGINQIELETGNIKTVLKNNKVNELLEGKEVTIESSEGLKSNTKIEYAIKFYDKNGKELKIKNNKGKTRTSKQEPKVTVKIKEQDIVSVTLGVKLTNKDSVKLENYKYIITRPNGEKLKEERLSEHEKEIKLEDLDQNQYYKIKVYADYDLSDNKGIQKDVEIGNLVFATKPISTLGSLEMIVENKELTSKNAKISYKIDEDKTDKRLIQILNELTIKIVENNDDNKEISKPSEEAQNSEKESQHTNRKTTKEGTVIYTNTLTKEEIKKLQLGETKEINYENLKSNTKYTIEITGNVELGNTKEEVPVTYIYKEFTTLKIPAKVEIKNQFVTGNLIDLDVRVKDEDNSVLNNKVRMELRDEKSNLIDLQEISTNEKYVRKTYEKLEENKTYKLSFYADQYNEGSTDETYKVNYLIKEIEIITEPGISGKIELRDLQRKGTGKNLIDVTSKINWRGIYFDSYNNYGKEYNKETNELKLYCKGNEGRGQKYLYDLSEYAGQTVTMSFSIKKDAKANIYIASKYTKLKNITNEINGNWQKYEYTTTIDKFGLLGFEVNSVNNEDAWMHLKDFQIELGDKKTKYEEFKYDLEASIKAEIVDKRNETEKYYIEKYENEELIEEKAYSKEIIAEEYFKVKSNNTYKFNLVIKRNNRKYIVGSQEFKTEDDKEIKGINSKEEYIETLNPEGDYIVFCDLDFRDGSRYKARFGNALYGFKGKIDFNGHKIITNSKKEPAFYKIEQEGTFENFVLEIYLDNEIEISFYQGLFRNNHGNIRNFKVMLQEATTVSNTTITLLGHTNFGTIENFVLEANASLYGTSSLSLGCFNNNGTMKNGYAYGENIKNINNKQNLDTGVVVRGNHGTMKNIYSLASVDTEDDGFAKITGNVIGYTMDTAKNENLYSVGYGKNNKLLFGPTIGAMNSNKDNKNIYYFADKIFNNAENQKNTPLALWNEKFQNQILNSENAFNVEALVEQGYYPQVKWPSCMPKQKYIKLPKVEDKDLPDILSTEVLESSSNTAKVKFSVNNPSAETITNIKIKNLECKIESQEYKEGESEVIAILSHPIICVSKYSVISISTKGAYNQEYTREFKEKERLIDIDFYKEIYTTEDWKSINKSGTENYRLMQDLNFRNIPNDSRIFVRYTGKLDGNNHTIRNIIDTSNYFIIHTIENEIKNLTFENVKISNNNAKSIILNANNIKNVFAKNVYITRTGTTQDEHSLAGLVENLTGYMENCGIENVTIVDETYSMKTYIGGLVGKAKAKKLNNCFAKGIKIKTKNNQYYGVGGLVGYAKEEEINNCYTEGKIEIEGRTVGGIVGTLEKSNVRNSYSYVNITGNVSEVGGIVGVCKEGANIINAISLGNLYTSKLSLKPNRILGSGNIKGLNYAYSMQRINGLVENLTEQNVKLLTPKDLLNELTYIKLNYANAFDYSGLKQNILPKLHRIDEDGTYLEEILPNQENMYLDILNELKIQQIDIEKSAVNQITGQIVIKNTNNLNITNLSIDGMDSNITNIITRDGKTYINLTATPIYYYDTYKISKIKYKIDETEYEETVEGKLEQQFYKELYNFEDWQSIDKDDGLYQNYRLMNDIDFTGKINVNSNVTMARLESVGEKKTLKNINLKFENVQETGLIKKITNNIKNIKFENIEIQASNDANGIGIISNCSAEISNLEFKNITINSKTNTIGCIANIVQTSVNNIKVEDVNVVGNQYVGGLVGQYDAPMYTLSDVIADDVDVNGSSSVGGIVGSSSINSNLIRITINNSNIKGQTQVGGIVGYRRSTTGPYGMQDIKAENNEIRGINAVGGIGGNINRLSNVISRRNLIFGTVNVGGIGGIAGGTSDNLYSIENDVIAESVDAKYIGGISGLGENYLSNLGVVKCNIKSLGNCVGGIFGHTNASTQNNISRTFIKDTNIEGKDNVAGIIGICMAGTIKYNYIEAKIEGNTNVGGNIGYLDNKEMSDVNNVISVYANYIANTNIIAKNNVGGLIGGISKELYIPEKHYYGNFVEANICSESNKNISLGIGNMPNQNQYLKDTYFYKYSSVNGKNPNEQNEIFIPWDKYLVEEELKQQSTYTSKLNWVPGYWDFSVLAENKYPILRNIKLVKQVGIPLPKDKEHIIRQELNAKPAEKLQNTFNYKGKIINTYETYSEIIAEDGSKAIRKGAKLYVKDGKLYVLPVELNLGDDSIKLVENNFIIDSYNGKEYETVLSLDGKLHDLKEPLNYPENFVNNGIVSIGNNLSSYANIDNEDSDKKENLHEVEVVYQNGNKIKFNYQTGEVISSSKGNEQNESSNTNSKETGLFDYMKEKILEIGNSNFRETQEITNKYEKSKVLQNKLEETPVEDALQIKNSNTNKVENTLIEQNNNMNKSDNVMIDQNDKANNSLKETRYISIYNAEKDEYQIYKEEELLDTTKQEVISENDKIEANNLNKYYAREGKSKNKNMGILWITLSIVGVIIILFAIKKRD